MHMLDIVSESTFLVGTLVQKHFQSTKEITRMSRELGRLL